MARRSQTADPEILRATLVTLLDELPHRLEIGTVGEQVGALVNVHHHLRDLGASIGATLAPNDSDSGRARLIAYFRAQVGKIVHTDELMIVAGIGDYPRRVRELRAKHGWPIISGMAVRDLRTLSAALAMMTGRSSKAKPGTMAPEEYMLIEDARDTDAIRRWKLAGRLRKEHWPTSDLIVRYLDASPGGRITAEELRYVAGNNSGWTVAIANLVSAGRKIEGVALNGAETPVGIFVP